MRYASAMSQGTPPLPVPSPDVLRALIQRVKAYEDRDPELDADISVALEGGEPEERVANGTMERYLVIKRPSRMHVQGFSREPVQPVTQSVDAAIALVVRTTPEANCFGVEYDPKNGWEGHVSRNFVQAGHWVKVGTHKTSGGAAVVIALLEAKLHLLAKSDTVASQATIDPIKGEDTPPS